MTEQQDRPPLRPHLAQGPTVLPPEKRPEPGGITILPEGQQADVADAVTGAGGEVVPLGERTRGIVCLDNDDVQGLLDALEATPGVTWVQLPFSGIDTFASSLVPYAARGVVFTSAKGAYAQPVAEHALALVLATLRGLPDRARATGWGSKGGITLYGAEVVIVGAGGIALELIELLRPFGCRTTIVRHSEQPVESADRTVQDDRLDEVLSGADVVVLAAAATAQTKGLIGAAQFAAMPATAVLVNIGRGPLVDTDALVAALDDGSIHGAGIDVTDPQPLPDGHPLYSHARSIVTPHSADTPDMVRPLLRERIAENVAAFVGGGGFVGLADPVRGY